jgi:hypothetical protein
MALVLPPGPTNTLAADAEPARPDAPSKRPFPRSPATNQRTHPVTELACQNTTALPALSALLRPPVMMIGYGPI